MNSNDKFQTPVGQISMVMHKGGIYIPETNSISPDAEIIEKQEIQNLIVSRASTLMAQRMAPGDARDVNTGSFIADGLQYLAVGIGAAGWDKQDPPAATNFFDATRLQNETSRKEFTTWTFLDAAGVATDTPTNVLRLVTTFMEGEAVGALVEMGLFGGNAGAGKDTGWLFNYKTFAVN